MKFKGTKGKWNIDEDKKSNQLVVTNHNETKAIAFLPFHNIDTKSNAKLIASAPELLESLIQALSLLEEANLPDCLLETQANFCANTFNLIKKATE